MLGVCGQYSLWHLLIFYIFHILDETHEKTKTSYDLIHPFFKLNTISSSLSCETIREYRVFMIKFAKAQIRIWMRKYQRMTNKRRWPSIQYQMLILDAVPKKYWGEFSSCYCAAFSLQWHILPVSGDSKCNCVIAIIVFGEGFQYKRTTKHVLSTNLAMEKAAPPFWLILLPSIYCQSLFTAPPHSGTKSSTNVCELES